MMDNGLLNYINTHRQDPAAIKVALFRNHIAGRKQDGIIFKAAYLAKLAGEDFHQKAKVSELMGDTIALIPGEILQEEYAKQVATLLKTKASLLLKKAKSIGDAKNANRHQVNNDLKRAKYVAEQAERRTMDITKDEDDLKDIVNGLAALGEPARDIFLRLCSQRDEYLKGPFDAMFTKALQEKRSKAANKFFKVALSYDLEVKVPKTIKEANDQKKASDIIGDDAMADDYNKYGIWEEFGLYKSLGQQGETYEVSNFKMRILWHVETNEDAAYRLIAIENIHGHKAVINMNTDDFESVGAFKKQIARKGNFIWKGSEVDLIRIKDKLQREEKPTKLVRNLGWHKRGKFYAWANGIYDVSEDLFIPVDEYGIVTHHIKTGDGEVREQNYFIPAMSKIYADKDELFANDKKFIYQESSIDFQQWSKQFCEVYGKQGEITLVYYIMALFSDIIFKDISERFPILSIYGKRGTGKGTMAKSIMKLFGIGQDQIMLGGASTAVGFMRKFAQFINAMVWLDEYKNNLPAKIIESIKNIFDRKGYERGKKDNSFDTESTPVYSACMLSGQEMPTIEPALFSRVILTILTETTFSQAQREQFRDLEKMEEAGLSHITVGLLKYRLLFAEKFRDTYDIELKKLIKEVSNNEIDERMFVNYAAMIAAAEVINTQEEMPFNMVSFREMAKKNLLEQFFVLKGSDDTSKFWDVVQWLFAERRIEENRHFLLANGYLYIKVGEIYPHYAKALIERKDPNGLDQQTLYKYLESDTKTYVGKKKKWYSAVGSQQWSHIFKLSELDIDLLRANTEDELKARYREMGMRYPEEEQTKLELKIKPD